MCTGQKTCFFIPVPKSNIMNLNKRISTKPISYIYFKRDTFILFLTGQKVCILEISCGWVVQFKVFSVCVSFQHRHSEICGFQEDHGYFSKISKRRKGWSVTPVVEHLHSKHSANDHGLFQD
jgi:hypothetical protein